MGLYEELMGDHKDLVSFSEDLQNELANLLCLVNKCFDSYREIKLNQRLKKMKKSFSSLLIWSKQSDSCPIRSNPLKL